MKFLLKAIILIVVAALVLFALVVIFGETDREADPITRVEQGFDYFKKKIFGENADEKINSTVDDVSKSITGLFDKATPSPKPEETDEPSDADKPEESPDGGGE